MKVLKFGGTSVAGAQQIARVIAIVENARKTDGDLMVVVSAFSTVTDTLISLIAEKAQKDNTIAEGLAALYSKHLGVSEQLVQGENLHTLKNTLDTLFRELRVLIEDIERARECSPRSYDAVVSFGERLSAHIVTAALKSAGIPATHIDARDIIITDDTFTQAKVDTALTKEAITAHIKKGSGVYVTGGFIGKTAEGATTTLGRGGSDYSAAIIGAALDVSLIEIWTDVDGVLTADPRKISNAFPLAEISYEEAGELSHFGAKVIHPKTMKPACEKRIPILIKNTFNPDAPGTRISATSAPTQYLIKGITIKSRIALLHIRVNDGHTLARILGRVSETLDRAGISVLLTTQASAEQSFTLAIEESSLKEAREVIESECALPLSSCSLLEEDIRHPVSILAIVGEQMRGVPGVAGIFFQALGARGISVVALAQGSRECNISAVIHSRDEALALEVIHERFFGKDRHMTHVFLVGTGLIGGTLLKQLAQHKDTIRIVAVADATQRYVHIAGVPPLEATEILLEKGEPMELASFIDDMTKTALPNRVFVDCTAQEEIADAYERVLRAHIAVVTPNKKANSGSQERFNTLRALSQSTGTPFCFETNVGAGLPVLNTIESLLASGDEIEKVEMAISGSLNYIFGEYMRTDKTFSAVVKEAKDAGYTEPDPRDDLSGLDVARKLLIVARLTGRVLELSDINVVPALSKEYMKGDTVAQFFDQLIHADTPMATKRLTAEQNSKQLVYLATLTPEEVSVGLRQLDRAHPCAALDGSSVTIAITTKRYRIPMIIKGPGAGAEVTAGGVLADILQTRIKKQ